MESIIKLYFIIIKYYLLRFDVWVYVVNNKFAGIGKCLTFYLILFWITLNLHLAYLFRSFLSLQSTPLPGHTGNKITIILIWKALYLETSCILCGIHLVNHILSPVLLITLFFPLKCLICMPSASPSTTNHMTLKMKPIAMTNSYHQSSYSCILSQQSWM